MQGDDYILHCHPMRQKVPKNGMLREWYLTMTRACQKLGIVTHTSNLWDLYFSNGTDHKTQASVLNMPYLDGKPLNPTSLPFPTQRPILTFAIELTS